MTESIENNVLTVRSSHASREFLTTLRKIRDDGLFLDIVLGPDFITRSYHFQLGKMLLYCNKVLYCVLYSRYTQRDSEKNGHRIGYR